MKKSIELQAGHLMIQLFECMVVCFSATLAALAFLIPSYCFWFIFIFLIPLFYAFTTQKVLFPFWYGLLWGTVFFGLHMHALLHVILERSYGRGGALIWLIFILYCAVYAAIWFWSATSAASYFKWRSIQLFCWIAVTVLFFLWVQHGLLIIGGRFEGYPFGQLLVPLIYYPQSLVLLPYCGASVLLTCLVLWSGFAAYFFMCPTLINAMAAALSLAPFCMGLSHEQPDDRPPDFLKNIAVVIPLSTTDHPLDIAQDIAERLTKCLEKNPDVNIIIMPESSFPFPLNKYEEMIKLWTDSMISEKVMLIIGSHRQEGNNFYNTLYCLKECRIILYYDKKHFVPLIEFLPHHLNITPLNKLFLYKKEQFSALSKTVRPREIIKMKDNLILMPYICSELFFAEQAPEEKNIPILCIANDEWFSSRYMCRLLYLTACYKARELQRNILYVSHRMGGWISIFGVATPLKMY